MKTSKISGSDFFKKILEDFQEKTQRDQATKNLFSQKCKYCGGKIPQNITMQYCSYVCFEKILKK